MWSPFELLLYELVNYDKKNESRNLVVTENDTNSVCEMMSYENGKKLQGANNYLGNWGGGVQVCHNEIGC